METSVLISLLCLLPAVASVLLNSNACTVDFCKVSLNWISTVCLINEAANKRLTTELQGIVRLRNARQSVPGAKPNAQRSHISIDDALRLLRDLPNEPERRRRLFGRQSRLAPAQLNLRRRTLLFRQNRQSASDM